MKKLLFISLILHFNTTFAQNIYTLNDISIYDIRGAVKSLSEFIIVNKDTIRTMKVMYNKNGFREKLITKSQNSDLTFSKDTTCYVLNNDTLQSLNCISGLKNNNTTFLNDQKKIIQVDVKYPNFDIQYVPEYDNDKRLKLIYTAKVDQSYQFIGTKNIAYNKNGYISEEINKGGLSSDIQGKITYFYNDKNLLIKTVRSEFDGNKIFSIYFSKYDLKENWLYSKLENGVIITRFITYY